MKRAVFIFAGLVFATGISVGATVDETWKQFATERKAGLAKLAARHLEGLEKIKKDRIGAGDLDGALGARKRVDAHKLRIANLEKLGAGEVAPMPPTPKSTGMAEIDALEKKHHSDITKGVVGLDRIYVGKLEALTRQFLKAGNIDDAKLSVAKTKWLQEEIARLDTSTPPKEDPPKKDPSGSEPDVKPPRGTNLVRKAKVEAQYRTSYLNDGKTSNRRYAYGRCPCNFIATFDRPYELGEIKFKLWDGGRRYYFYKLHVSEDGEKWETIADHSRRQSRGWQEHSFLRRKVKVIKLEGLHNSDNEYFHVVELEAYPP